MQSPRLTTLKRPLTMPTTAHTYRNTMELFCEHGQSRRLLKARHQEMNKMEIKTKTLSAVLYEQSLEVTRFTVYKFQIKSKVRRGDTGEWTLAKRYSEFFGFRRDMLKLIQQWELKNEECQKSASREFVVLSNALRRLIIPNFPRKHMRLDTKSIVDERRPVLEELLRKLLEVYADMSVYMYNKQNAKDANEADALLSKMFLSLEAFLDIPETQKEAERRQMAAILALEEVTVEATANDCHDRTCCICLDDIESDDEDEEDQVEADKMVKLGCGHQFHEDCVIGWFNASTTCPLCRQPAFEEEALSFDVQAH